MIANAAGVQLHDESVFNAHAGHLGEHLRLEEFRVSPVSGFAVDEASVEAGCILAVERSAVRAVMWP